MSVTGTLLLGALLLLATPAGRPIPTPWRARSWRSPPPATQPGSSRPRPSVPEALRADPAFRSAAAGRALAAVPRRGGPAGDVGRLAGGCAGCGRRGAIGRRRSRSCAPWSRRRRTTRTCCVRWPSTTAWTDDRGGGAPDRADPRARAADPWFGFAAMAAAVRGRRPSEAEPLLSAFVAAHPGIHPPRMSLARARLALGDREGAVGALDDLLAADPDHEAAKALKAGCSPRRPWSGWRRWCPPAPLRPPRRAGCRARGRREPRGRARAGSAPRRSWRRRAPAWRPGARPRRTW